MNTNKILSADLLDLVFDDRNKEYGAYQLRKTYHRRMKKALIITSSVTVLVFAGTVFANTFKAPSQRVEQIRNIIELTEITEEPELLPPQIEKKPEPVQIQTRIFSTLDFVEETEEPPVAVEDLKDVRIGLEDLDGIKDEQLADPGEIIAKGIIEAPKQPEGPLREVQVPAEYEGNWGNYLLKYLRGEVPVENGAPTGRHKVIIEFVVDVDGTLSNIKPLTNIGYGLEEEAIRVIKKSKKWRPAIQNGYQVKAYRVQTIVFDVSED
jgi:periplasmic protein TonB